MDATTEGHGARMIVAVTGGKGGVGKSTIALNLGHQLEAVVVDGDLTMADLPRGRGPDLHDVLAGRATPLEAIQQVGPVEMLPCGRSLAGARAADLTSFGQVVEAVAREFEHVVVDGPAGLASDVGVQLHSADVAIVVTTADDAALVDAVKARRLARKLETPVGGAVLNRVSDPERRVEVVERALGVPVTEIPEEPAVQAAQSIGRPIDEITSESVAIDRISSLARTLEREERRVRRSRGDR